MSELVGTTIDGRFEVIRSIGKGGYGDVFEARQLSVDRAVALKVVHAHLAERPDVSARFRREAKLTSRLDHPNAIRVIDFGDDGGLLYLVMDYVAGPTLKEHLRERGPLPPSQSAAILRDVAAALHAAHAIGLVHRDLKPSNIILSETAAGIRPVVIDFGLVKVFSEDAPGNDVTASHMMIGTPAYMSPEGVLGRPVDGRSDIYALGVMLFEMLTGERPFSGQTQMEIATARIHGPAPSLPEAFAPKVRSLVTELLEPDPHDRVATADEVVSRLRGWSRFGETPTTLMDVDRTVAPLRGPAARSEPAAAPHHPPSANVDGRRPFLVWAGLAIALCLAIIGGLMGAAGDGADALETLETPTIMTSPSTAETPPPTDEVQEGSADLAAPITANITPNAAVAPGPVAPHVDDHPEDPADRAADESDDQATDREAAASEPRPRRETRRQEEPGIVRINAAPAGDVLVDGEAIGAAPQTVTLPPGQYEITTRYSGAEISETVRVRSGETESITHWH